MKKSLLISLILLFWPASAYPASNGFEYQLYKNFENFGILVFPKALPFPGLEQSIQSLGFEPVESGKAVMRSGTKGENETYMMPLAAQKKHAIEKFIVLQVLSDRSLLVGIYDPEWGLTLPSSVFQLGEIQEKVQRTLDVFRGGARKNAQWENREPSVLTEGETAFINPAIIKPSSKCFGGKLSYARL